MDEIPGTVMRIGFAVAHREIVDTVVDDRVHELPALHLAVVIGHGFVVSDVVVLCRNVHPAPDVVRVLPKTAGVRAFQVVLDGLVSEWAADRYPARQLLAPNVLILTVVRELPEEFKGSDLLKSYRLAKDSS